MAPKKSRRFSNDAPWRAASGEKTVPKISQGVVCAVREGPNFNYAMSVIKHPDPIGYGLASEAFVEPAGPDCIIPGLTRPVRVLGVQVWPINLPANVSVKALEPIGRELKSFSKMLDKAFDLMQAPFGDR
ncbi:hypothetical protein R1flu_028624 [Riccia fluitans]|uniref:Uncharacterized protein n=1 Tax=Riccia fluitans TaxID=41844 RepID=A0ABD1XQ38_9MARC